MKIEQYLNLNNINIFTKIYGKGEPLIFLHGGPGGEHRYFLPHLLGLTEDFTLIFYDQLGCGLSDHLTNENYTMDGEVEILEALRKRLGIEKVNLIGESWGSMLALLYAVKYPDQVNKIFMTAAVGATRDAFLRFGGELENRLTNEEKQLLKTLERQLEDGEVDVKEIFKIIDPYYVFNVETLQKRMPTKSNAAVNQIMGKDIIENYDVSVEAGKLKHIPIFVAQGDHDIMTPAILEEVLLKYIPHIEVSVIENCGHWSVIEQPVKLQSLIRNFFS